jgi:hypothetical protein
MQKAGIIDVHGMVRNRENSWNGGTWMTIIQLERDILNKEETCLKY